MDYTHYNAYMSFLERTPRKTRAQRWLDAHEDRIRSMQDLLWPTYGVTSRIGRFCDQLNVRKRFLDGWNLEPSACPQPSVAVDYRELTVRHRLMRPMPRRLPFDVHCHLGSWLQQDRETLLVAEPESFRRYVHLLEKIRCELDNLVCAEYPNEPRAIYAYYGASRGEVP